MKIMLATLVLNEIEWIEKVYLQHRHWPSACKWVFVEGADDQYAAGSPKMVSSAGLSVDGTTEYLADLAKFDDRVIHIPYGVAKHSDPAQGKCVLRNEYLRIADEVEPDYLIVIDGDEFYPEKTQQLINRLLQHSLRTMTAFCFKQRHIWRPPSIQREPLFQYEVVKGFWEIPHCRVWRWRPGIRYIGNHNTPSEVNGKRLDRGIKRYDMRGDGPECIHLGFASNILNRKAKHKYYKTRGEGKNDHRGWYVQSRTAFEYWQPGLKLPKNAEVIPYAGPIPEIFQAGALEWAGKERGETYE